MIIPKSIADLNQMIADGVEENISLDYKAADALQNTDGKKKEIAKDVSAMANAAGGVIIYGIKEFDTADKKHLPEKITPVNRQNFSKEQLEQLINNNISPKIEGLIIHPIQLLNPDEVVYVIEIPQSDTAHQNTKDQRYYRRYNFESVPMLDYEIRDIMNRLKHPDITLDFEILSEIVITKPVVPIGRYEEEETVNTLKIFLRNQGKIFANYVNYYIYVNRNFLNKDEYEGLKTFKEDNSGRIMVEYFGENTMRDVVDVKFGIGEPIYKYGPSRFDPILPQMHSRAQEIKLVSDINLLKQFDNEFIRWKVYADNASVKEGKIRIGDITYINKTEK